MYIVCIETHIIQLPTFCKIIYGSSLWYSHSAWEDGSLLLAILLPTDCNIVPYCTYTFSCKYHGTNMMTDVVQSDHNSSLWFSTSHWESNSLSFFCIVGHWELHCFLLVFFTISFSNYHGTYMTTNLVQTNNNNPLYYSFSSEIRIYCGIHCYLLTATLFLVIYYCYTIDSFENDYLYYGANLL